jgi:hypothetical protein
VSNCAQGRGSRVALHDHLQLNVYCIELFRRLIHGGAVQPREIVNRFGHSLPSKEPEFHVNGPQITGILIGMSTQTLAAPSRLPSGRS